MAKSLNSQQKLERRQRGFSRYKRSETTRLLRSVADVGLTVRGLEVDPVTGVLRVLVGGPDTGAKPQGDDLDAWIEQKKEKDARPA